MMMENSFEGNLFVFGDHVNTDMIIPTPYLSNSEEEMGKYCMKDLDPTFAKRAQKGDIVAAGINFGCGSTKNGSGALKGAGIVCVIAKSFGRIFFRNAINAGLLLIECPEFVDDCEAGDRVRVNYSQNEVINITKNRHYSFPEYPQLISRIIRYGGIVPMIEALGVEAMNAD